MKYFSMKIPLFMAKRQKANKKQFMLECKYNFQDKSKFNYQKRNKHPPYLADLAPCDYHTPKIKLPCRGTLYQLVPIKK